MGVTTEGEVVSSVHVCMSVYQCVRCVFMSEQAGTAIYVHVHACIYMLEVAKQQVCMSVSCMLHT